MTQRINTLLKADTDLSTLTDNVLELLNDVEITKPTNNRETVNTIKALISLCKVQTENMEMLTRLIEAFDDAQSRFASNNNLRHY